MNPIIQSNIEFANESLDYLGSVKTQVCTWVLRHGDDGALHHVIDWYLQKHESLTASDLRDVLQKRMQNGTGVELSLWHHEALELFHILTSYVVENELPEDVMMSLGEVS